MTLFETSDSAKAKPGSDNSTNPKHWFVVVGDGPYQVRNLTIGQTLLGEYGTKASARKIIKAIASKNPTFQLKGKR